MLVSKGLLNTKVYMCRLPFSLPYILGFVTYFFMLVFSVFLWQLTAVRHCQCLPPVADPDDFHIEEPGAQVDCVWTRGSFVLVEMAVFVPIVLVVGVNFFKTWIHNDYEIMPSWGNPALRCEVREVFIVHVGGARCVTSSTANNMKIQARITWTVECIRTCLVLF